MTTLERFNLTKEPDIKVWWPRLVIDDRFYKEGMPILYTFFEEFRFLSNFHVQPITWQGKVYQTTEAAYQADKTDNEDFKEQIRLASGPGSARKMGQAVLLRKNWDAEKEQAMREIVTLKFMANADLAMKLMKTDGQYLVESTVWHDNFWGICIKKDCEKGCGEKKGLNTLGKILMEIRQALCEGYLEEIKAMGRIVRHENS